MPLTRLALSEFGQTKRDSALPGAWPKSPILLPSYHTTKAASLKTKVSTKGQVVLPKAIRDKRGFGPGAELIVEERPEGLLLRPAPRLGGRGVEDVFVRLGPVDRVVSIEEMHQAVLNEAARRYRNAVEERD